MDLDLRKVRGYAPGSVWPGRWCTGDSSPRTQ